MRPGTRSKSTSSSIALGWKRNSGGKSETAGGNRWNERLFWGWGWVEVSPRPRRRKRPWSRTVTYPLDWKVAALSYDSSTGLNTVHGMDPSGVRRAPSKSLVVNYCLGAVRPSNWLLKLPAQRITKKDGAWVYYPSFSVPYWSNMVRDPLIVAFSTHIYGSTRSLTGLQDTYVFTGSASIYLCCCTITSCSVCTIIPRGIRAPLENFLYKLPKALALLLPLSDTTK